MGGFGASGSGGQGFAIRLEADGDTKLGNSDGDLHQVTGTLHLNENVFFLANGRLGIGTDAPDYKLDVAGNIGVNEHLYHNGDGDTRVSFPSANQINLVAGGKSVFKFASNTITLNNGNNDIDTKIMADNGQEVVFVNAGNNRVGIGTTSPGEVLHVDGNLEVSGNDPRVKIHGIEDSHPGLEFYEAGTRKWIIFNNYGDDSLDFKTNSNTRMVINQDGTVGIGTQSPASKLHVDGEVRATVMSSSAGATFLGDVITKDIKASGSITVAGTAITSTPAELNLLDASVTSEASDGVWAVVERVAKITVDSNDYARSSGPVSLGVTIPDNAILTKYVFDCTQTFAAGDDGSEAMAVVDLGLYNASGKVFDFASQANIERTGADFAPYVAAVSEVSPLAAASTKLTEALTAKIHVFDDGSGMLNSLDAGALDIYVYYIIGA
jgi:hypothetical protein